MPMGWSLRAILMHPDVLVEINRRMPEALTEVPVLPGGTRFQLFGLPIIEDAWMVFPTAYVI